MIKAKYTQLIDDYRDGKLTDSERLEFENSLNTDSQLAHEFNLHKDLDTILSDQKLIDFRATLIDAQHDYNKSQRPIPKIVRLAKKYRYAAASVILLLMIVGSILIMNPRHYTNERLFQMYYKSGDAIGITRSGNVNTVEAIMKFHDGDYQGACKLFNDVLKENAANIAIRYYYGIASIEVQNYDRAIKQFTEIIDNDDNLYIEYAQWYLGLTYLISGQSDKALNQISAIASDLNHYYNDEAKDLYDKIKKASNK